MFQHKKIVAGSLAAFILAIIASIILSGNAASAARLITGDDVRNGSLTGKDIQNGSIGTKKLNDDLRIRINTMREVDRWQSAQIAALQHQVNRLIEAGPAKDGAPGAPGQDGKDGSVAGVQKNWDAKDGASIVDEHTVTLSNVGTPAGSSVEITELNLPVQATKQLSFTYALSGGAVYAAGSPRVFLEISGDFFNTFDANPSDAGVDNGDGTFTKTVTIPKNGRVGAAGIVVDNGVGSVTVTNLTVDGQVLSFK